MPSRDLADLSIPSRLVLLTVAVSILYLICRFFVWIFSGLKKILWKPQKPGRAPRPKVKVNPASSSQSTTPASPQPSITPKPTTTKPKSSKQKKIDGGKALEHPLYIFALKDHRDTVNGFGWAHNGSVLASACEDRCVRLFTFTQKIDKGILTKQVNISAIPIDVEFLSTPDNFVVLCKGLLDSACLFFYAHQENDLGGSSWNCIRTVEKLFGNDPPLKLASTMNPSNSKVLIVALSSTKEAKIYDHNGVVLSSIAPNSFFNYDLAVSYQAKLASVATFTADAKIWELQFSSQGIFKGSPKVMDLRGHKSKVNTVAISIDATRAVSVSQDGIMKVWNTDVNFRQDEDPRCLLTVKLDLPDGQYYHRLAFGPDFALAAVVHTTLHFLDVEKGSVIGSVEHAHDSPITSLQWAPLPVMCAKGKIRVLASSSKDKRVRMWAHPQDI